MRFWGSKVSSYIQQKFRFAGRYSVVTCYLPVFRRDAIIRGFAGRTPPKNYLGRGLFIMKIKKIAALLLAGSMIASFAACTNNGKKTRDDEETTTTTEETTTETTTEATTEATSEETTDAGITETSESEATSKSAESSESKADNGTAFAGKIIDFEDMHFYVKGKKYTLGSTTLQEMIDDGVPFKENDLKIASKEMKKNSQSLNGFSIQLDKSWSVIVYVMNVSSDAKPMSDCVIYRVYMYNIEKNYKNGADFAFEFPYTMKMDELIANAGEPKEAANKVHDEGTKGNYTDTFRYRQKSKKYLGSREYQFVFIKGEMSKITITYIP